jgi:mRNA-degrading endonuclease toxin of MazEF toxin-antitoxin module
VKRGDLYRVEHPSARDPKLTNYIGELSASKLDALNRALAIALEIPD